MLETIKWTVIRLLIKWNVLAVVPVYAQDACRSARRTGR